MVGRIKLIKNNYKRICKLNNAKGSKREKKCKFDRLKKSEQRKAINAINSSCAFILKNERRFKGGLRNRIQNNKLKLKRITKEKNFARKSTIVKDQVGSGLLGLISKGVGWLVNQLAS